MSKIKTKTKTHIIPHTHWDAEWYFTSDDTNVLLLNNTWDAIKKLNKTKYPFTWDGQVYPFHVFYKIEKNKENLEVIKNKKLLIGPWFTQSNAKFILGENYYRNLEYGIYLSKKYGHSLNYSMMFDIFGFSDQVPQILLKNKIKSAVFMRGWDPKSTNNINEFQWKSPSGHTIFAKVPHQGYGNAKFFGEKNLVEKQYVEMKNNDIEKTISNVSLLLNGGDQMFFRGNLEKIIKKYEDEDKSQWILSNFSDYFDSVSNSLNNDFSKLPVYEGDMSNPIGQRVHLTSYSQRQDINNIRGNLEYKLVYILEPLNVMYNSLTQLDYSNLIYEVWEKLFLSSAHDAAAGCNSDSTNASIRERLLSANRLVDSSIEIIQKNLSMSKGNDILSIYSTNFSRKSITARIKITTTYKYFSLNNFGKKISYLIINSQKLSKGKKILVTPNGDVEKQLGSYYLHDVFIYLHDVVPLSIIDLNIVKVKNINVKKAFLDSPNIKLKIEANDGDSYDFSPTKDGYMEEHKIDIKNLEGFQQNNIEYFKKTFSVETYNDFLDRKNKITQNFNLEIIKTPSGRLDFNLKTNNRVHNAKFSIVIDDKENIDFLKGNSLFYEKKYKNKDIPKNWRNTYREKPVNVFPFVGYLYTKNIIFASRTLREFQFKDKSLQITLMRTNGTLGKDDILWRPGRASGVNDIKILTLDAQMKTKINFDFSLLPKYDRDDLFDYLVEYTGYQNNSDAKHKKRLQRFFLPKQKIMGDLPKIKKSDQIDVKALYVFNKKIFLRLLNPSNQYLKNQIIKFNNKEWKVNFKPWEIITIKI